MPAEGEAINPEWRLYARSSSDDKAGVMSILTAFDALRAQKIAPTVNLKLFFEGEEEAGSPHLVEILSRHKELLAADAWVICDGPVHQSGRKQVVFGVRGDTNVEVTVYGPKRPLHSGHYGNWAPNPAMLLARLLVSMKDARGRVTIKGWYDDVEPLGEAERRALADAPAYDRELMKELGINRPEGAGRSLLELINEPSLNVNGLSSAETGALARNVIPTTAVAAGGLPPRHPPRARSSGSSRTSAPKGFTSPSASRPTKRDSLTRSSPEFASRRAATMRSGRGWTCPSRAPSSRPCRRPLRNPSSSCPRSAAASRSRSSARRSARPP
jgi:acetylornithine deacetylase/succinyl-diaminopimelate desuccinylase-like protein